jgi:hypothetical protein
MHHPQTMGKLSNAQKGLKRFLIHRLGSRCTDHESIFQGQSTDQDSSLTS